ncbi:putative membrane protein [[Clostridium] bifermentans ATCC 19299]|nr:putative membrane protein [[Clostridium] bifermentans ATCC 19299] [Paraclostridium bifermentans ATCC 19299]
MSIGKKVPGWLLISLGIVILLLVIQSLYIVYCKKAISHK